MKMHRDAGGGLPFWMPHGAQAYLSHTEDGLSIRALARAEGCHASTVLRRVRRFEQRRDDPLVDEALVRLSRLRRIAGQDADSHDHTDVQREDKDDETMTAPIRTENLATDAATIAREGRRILRRLCEAGAILAIAPDMEKAVVLRETADGRTVRTAVVDRTIAQVFAMKEWIICRKQGRVAAYEITGVGRAALKRFLAEDQHGAGGFAESRAGFDAVGLDPDGSNAVAGANAPRGHSPFAEQHRTWGERTETPPGESTPRRMRYNLAESPLVALARRRDPSGVPFLAADLVTAGERLREDFELAQMGPRVAQNWDRFLTTSDRGGFASDSGLAEGPRAARDRVAAALRDLGPGLGDMVLRCCCLLEGLEVAERRLGWSARSGKIVLRIALIRLKRHYEETGNMSPLIG